MRRAALAVFAASLLMATASAAQSSDRPEARRTIINLEEGLIIGVINKPDHVVTNVHVKTNFRSLIQIRKDFRGELLGSAHGL